MPPVRCALLLLLLRLRLRLLRPLFAAALASLGRGSVRRAASERAGEGSWSGRRRLEADAARVRALVAQRAAQHRLAGCRCRAARGREQLELTDRAEHAGQPVQGGARLHGNQRLASARAAGAVDPRHARRRRWHMRTPLGATGHGRRVHLCSGVARRRSSRHLDRHGLPASVVHKIRGWHIARQRDRAPLRKGGRGVKTGRRPAFARSRSQCTSLEPRVPIARPAEECNKCTRAFLADDAHRPEFVSRWRPELLSGSTGVASRPTTLVLRHAGLLKRWKTHSGRRTVSTDDRLQSGCLMSALVSHQSDCCLSAQ